jgi:autotransporter adhesin
MNIAKAVADVQKLVAAATAASSDCTGEKRVGDMQTCIADVEDIVKVVQDVVSQVSSGSPNFAQLLQDVQQVMGDVTKAKQDCNFSRSTVQGSCAADL